MTLSDDVQNLMRLLSQLVFADGHVFQSEIEALISGVHRLRLKDSAGQVLSPIQIRNWFDGYMQELNETSSDAPKDVEITRLILSLADWPDKQSVIETLEKISYSDADFHKEEKLLISIVKAYWQYDGLDADGATIGA